MNLEGTLTAAAMIGKAQTSLDICKEGVDRLAKKLTKLRKKDDPKGFRQVIKAGGLRLLYPFQKDTLEKLQAIVQDLLQRLMFALDILQVDIGAKTHTAVGDVRGQLHGLETRATAIDATTQETHKEVVKNSLGVQTLMKSDERQKLHSILNWLSAPDPFINHNDARRRHEPGTGEWFLQSSHYRSFVGKPGSRLWLHGKAGCCKTVLCSTVIENLTKHVAAREDCALAFFYFSFTDRKRQKYRDLLLSLVDQLSRGRPIEQSLEEAYTKRGEVSTSSLETILISLAQRKARLYFILDALDESQEGLQRCEVLEGLRKLTKHAHQLSLMVLSRPESDIRDCMAQLSANAVAANDAGIDADIKLYVEAQLCKLPSLRRLPSTTKEEIVSTFERKADGMYVPIHVL